MERNLCKESGCPAACCQNMTGHIAGRAEIFKQAFPDAVAVDEKNEQALKERIRIGMKGVFYYEERGWTYFAISGACPNLGEDFNCKIHEGRFYPFFCRNFVFKSQKCTDARELHKINLQVSSGKG